VKDSKTYSCWMCKKRKERDRFYVNKKHYGGVDSTCIKCRKEYDKNRSRAGYYKKYSKENKQKIQAKWKAQYAIKTGKLKKQPCEVCGNKKAEKHHEDYSKPLEVKWLCHKHHMEFHRNKALDGLMTYAQYIELCNMADEILALSY